MAIGPKGEVTTTGLMNSTGKIPEAPDMSNLSSTTRKNSSSSSSNKTSYGTKTRAKRS